MGGDAAQRQIQPPWRMLGLLLAHAPDWLPRRIRLGQVSVGLLLRQRHLRDRRNTAQLAVLGPRSQVAARRVHVRARVRGQHLVRPSSAAAQRLAARRFCSRPPHDRRTGVGRRGRLVVRVSTGASSGRRGSQWAWCKRCLAAFARDNSAARTLRRLPVLFMCSCPLVAPRPVAKTNLSVTTVIKILVFTSPHQHNEQVHQHYLICLIQSFRWKTV